MPKKTPYLKINNKPIYMGDTYYTVHFDEEDKKAIKIKHIAGNENNVNYYSYHLDNDNAERKVLLLELKYHLNKAIALYQAISILES